MLLAERIAEMKANRVACSPIDEQRWGSITRVTLPGGGKIGVYQPKHPSPIEPPKATRDRSSGKQSSQR